MWLSYWLRKESCVIRHSADLYDRSRLVGDFIPCIHLAVHSSSLSFEYCRALLHTLG